MKKFLIGMIIGMTLMIPLSVTANDISELIGKKVQGTVDILMDGEKIAEAVIIDGVSYAPVRKVAEMTGLDVSFVDRKVILQAKEGQVVLEAENSKSAITPEESEAIMSWNRWAVERGKKSIEVMMKETEIGNLNGEIYRVQSKLQYLEMGRTEFGTREELEEQLNNLEAQRETALQELDVLKQELEEILANEPPHSSN